MGTSSPALRNCAALVTQTLHHMAVPVFVIFFAMAGAELDVASFASLWPIILLLAVEETPEDMQDSGDTLGLGITSLARDGRLHFANIGRPMDGPTIVSGEYDVFGLIHRIEAMVKQTGARAVILDSATALFSPRPNHSAGHVGTA